MISGSNGLLGSRIVELLTHKHSFIPLQHTDVDITNKNNVNTFLQKNKNFDIFLHCAAYTQVDKAEQEPNSAYQINVDGTKNLFTSTTELGKKFILISTDFVFDGNNPPYNENSQTNAISIYGKTKLQAEEIVKGHGMIARTSYPFRKEFDKKNDFVRSILSILQQNKQLNMITDSLITPTFIDDIAYGLDYLLEHYSSEIFHLTGSSSLSPYEAGKIIAHTFHMNPDLIQPTTYTEFFKGKAQRPQFSEIQNTKITTIHFKSFQEAIIKIS